MIVGALGAAAGALASWLLAAAGRPHWLFDRHYELRLRVRAVVRELDRRSAARSARLPKGGEFS